MSSRHEARIPLNLVQLGISPLGGIPGATAYHSSVLVNGEEFSFSDAGITTAQGPASHQANTTPARLIDMGKSSHSGRELQATLSKHFVAGTYDLLRKNCNSFSDAALFFLLNKRLDQQYRTLDRLGSRQAPLVQAISGGKYSPNPKAADFDLEQLIADMDPEKVWRTPGHAMGGANASSAEAMRNARLARFSATEEHMESTLTSQTISTASPLPILQQADMIAEDEQLARQLQAELEEPLFESHEQADVPLTEDERLARQLLAEDDERFARQFMIESDAPITSSRNGFHGRQHAVPRSFDATQQFVAGVSSLLASVSTNGSGPRSGLNDRFANNHSGGIQPDPAQQVLNSVMSGLEQFNSVLLRMTSNRDRQQHSGSAPVVT